MCYLEPDFLLLESLFLFDSNNKPREETNILQLNTINEVIKVFFVLLKDGKFDVLVRYWWALSFSISAIASEMIRKWLRHTISWPRCPPYKDSRILCCPQRIGRCMFGDTGHDFKLCEIFFMWNWPFTILLPVKVRRKWMIVGSSCQLPRGMQNQLLWSPQNLKRNFLRFVLWLKVETRKNSFSDMSNAMAISRSLD